MTRHSISILFFAFLVSLLASQPASAETSTRWEQRAARKKELTKNVVWLSHEPIEFVLRRGGEHYDDIEREYAVMTSEENIRRMAAAGVRFNQIYFYKGYGVTYEKGNFETAKRAVALMRSLGIKTSLYVGGTMFIETFYKETPAAKNWERRNQYDQWIPYGTQTFRRYACTNEPAYRDYLKRMLKYAVEKVRPDEIFFDNLMLQAEPQSCRCPRCIAEFHKYLKAKYPTPEQARRRFGLPDTDSVCVNEWESAAQAAGITQVNDPVLQEWTRFRCETLAEYVLDLVGYVKSLNPTLAINLNLKGIYSFNRCWTNAVYQPLYAGHFDFIHFDTGGYDARVDPATGALVSQIRSYKLARQLRANCLDVLEEDDLRTAVHMAFSYQKPLPGWPGAPWHEGLNHDFTPLLEFFREYNARYFTNTQNIADVAVLRNWPSMAYSVHAAHVSPTLVEQVLIQHKIPFDILHEENLGGIARYGALILAGQECVSREQADLLLRYVRNGGTLIITDNTAEYNEWRETWRVNPLLPARTEGKGRIIHIPRVIPALALGKSTPLNEDPEPGATLRPGEQMNPTQWVLPRNHEAISKTVVDALPNGPSIATNAPLTTVLELLNRDETHETIAHFVNFDQTKPTGAIDVSLRAQYPGKVKSVTCFSPDKNDPVPLAFKRQGDRITFSVPSVRLYSMIVVEHAP